MRLYRCRFSKTSRLVVSRLNERKSQVSPSLSLHVYGCHFLHGKLVFHFDHHGLRVLYDAFHLHHCLV